MNKPKYIIIHHSATTDNVLHNWKDIKLYHINVKGYKDIGYHFGIENIKGEYEVLLGRSKYEIGAHTIGFNEKSIGICCVGNFDLVEPGPNMIKLCIKLVKDLQKEFNIPTNNVIAHRESYPLINKPVEKSCCGKRFNMYEFRKCL